MDIHTDYYLTLSQAALGSKVRVKTLYGDLDLPIEKGTQQGDRKKLVDYVTNKYFFNTLGNTKIK